MKSRVVGSSPASSTILETMERKILVINEPLGDPACPYCYRWVLNLGLIAFRLHKWVASDDLRYHHDHPYWFITFVLRGSYINITDGGEEVLKPGCVRFRRAEHRHAVKLVSKSCCTFLISGPPLRKWGFWVKGKFMRREVYFQKFGSHQCD